MPFSQQIRKSYREFQQRWARLADSAFGKAVFAANDEAARGEFISAFICERRLKQPGAEQETLR